VSQNIDWWTCDRFVDVSVADLLRVHEAEYIHHLENKAKRAGKHSNKESNGHRMPPFYSPDGR
jgi:hypothetical protein